MSKNCPRCEQGIILKKVIKKINQQIYICDECDAVWFHEREVGIEPFVDFGTYMLEISLQPLWSELE